MRKHLLIGLAFAVMVVYFGTHDSGMIKIIAVSNAAELAYTPQISDKQSIKITVAPRNILETTKNWDFEVAVESHTQDLSDDLAKSAMLIADGKQYLPLLWEGAPPGGHHRKGLLRFKTIVPRPSSIELQIRLAGDAAPRSFKWLLK